MRHEDPLRMNRRRDFWRELGESGDALQRPIKPPGKNRPNTAPDDGDMEATAIADRVFAMDGQRCCLRT